MNRGRPEPSATAKAFGAKLELSMPDRGLYLVKGHDASLAMLVKQTGGHIAVILSPKTLLAILPIAGYFSLQGAAGIAFVGPVSIDQQRFARFAGLFKLNPDQRAAVKRDPSGPTP